MWNGVQVCHAELKVIYNKTHNELSGSLCL